MTRLQSTEIEVQDLRVAYGAKEVLHGHHASTSAETRSSAVIGPANSGKTTLLRCINRTIDFAAAATVAGQVRVDGEDVRRTKDVYELRRKVGMVLPLPVGLPLSVYENVAYAPRCAGRRRRRPSSTRIVERCLRQAMLWDEVKDRLTSLGTALSGGQQQRLTLARALSHQPEILCLDEFSIAIDPVTTMRIEDVLRELRQRDDDRPGDQPGAAGPAAGRPHGVPVRRRDRGGRPTRDDLLGARRQTGAPATT